MKNQHPELPHLLLRIAEQNDERAFALFFDRYHTKLLRYASLYVASIEEAEDVVSDVLTKMLKNRKETFAKENFIGYLFQSIKNGCIDHLKREKRRSGIFDINYHEKDYFIFDSQTPFSQIVQSELTRLLRDRIEALPPKRRMVFQLIKDEDMSYREVAELMDISERTVEVHLRLAMRDLREALEAYMDQNRIAGSKKDLSGLLSLLLPFLFL